MKKLNHNPVCQVRIIGGQWKKRKLMVLNTSELRPTTNRIRETLFNWLATHIVNANCLDCFAGSGSLGFEALSRFAASATFLEKKFSIVKQIRKNVTVLEATNAKVINVNTLSYLRGYGTPYDIVFVDPPFRKGLLRETLSLLEQNGWLATNALVYVESEVENHTVQVPDYWNLYRTKISGQVMYRLYVR